jgi:hypothetical protein
MIAINKKHAFFAAAVLYIWQAKEEIDNDESALIQICNRHTMSERQASLASAP